MSTTQKVILCLVDQVQKPPLGEKKKAVLRVRIVKQETQPGSSIFLDSDRLTFVLSSIINKSVTLRDHSFTSLWDLFRGQSYFVTVFCVHWRGVDPLLHYDILQLRFDMDGQASYHLCKKLDVMFILWPLLHTSPEPTHRAACSHRSVLKPGPPQIYTRGASDCMWTHSVWSSNAWILIREPNVLGPESGVGRRITRDGSLHFCSPQVM